MLDDLINEYLCNANAIKSLNQSDPAQVPSFNKFSDRMRSIVDTVVEIGQDAVIGFTSVLNDESAACWAAHHLVEKAELTPRVLQRCYQIVDRAREDAEAKGHFADAMGEEIWLKEWRARKG